MSRRWVVLGALLVALVGVALLALDSGSRASDRASPGAPPERALPTEPEETSTPPPTLRGTPEAPTSPGAPTTVAPAAPPARFVRGRVVGEDGTAIEGATVRGVTSGFGPIPHNLTTPDPTDWPSTRSDSDGRFELPLRGGATHGMQVVVSARGWFHPSPAPSTFLPADREETVTLARGVGLRVRVLEEAARTPIEGAHVSVYASQGYVLYMGRPVVEGFTDAEGAADLRVPGGSLRVVADAPGFAQVEGEALSVGPDGAETTIRLRRGGSLGVLVVDPEGRPVSGARVALLRAPAVHARGSTDAEGRHVFENVPPRGASDGNVEAVRIVLVAAEADGYARTWLATEPPREGGTSEVRVVLARRRMIQGRARYGDGAAAADLPVRATTREGRPEWGWMSSTQSPGRVRTTDDGAFEVPGVTPGEVSIWFDSLSSGEPAARLEVPATGHIPPVEVVLARKPPEVRVRVLSAGGTPVRGAAVGLLPVDTREGGTGLYSSRRMTGADGLVTVQPAGDAPWWMFVDAPDAGPLLRRVEAAESTRGPIEVRPGPGTVEGRAERLDGSPARVRLALSTTLRVGGANMILQGQSGAVETDAGGGFVFVGVHEGVDDLRSITPGFSVLPGSLPAFGIDARGLRVVVIDESEAAGLRVEVDILDEEGARPLPVRAQVLLTRPGEAASWPAFHGTANPSLHRTETALTPGTWKVRATAEGYDPAEADVTVAAGRPSPRIRLLMRRSR